MAQTNCLHIAEEQYELTLILPYIGAILPSAPQLIKTNSNEITKIDQAAIVDFYQNLALFITSCGLH